MSVQTFTEWTCERCGGRKRNVVGHFPDPMPSITYVSRNVSKELTVCEPCLRAFWEFMRNEPEEST